MVLEKRWQEKEFKWVFLGTIGLITEQNFI